MTTHELASLLLQHDDVKLFIDDEDITAPHFETIVLDMEDETQAVIFWTKE